MSLAYRVETDYTYLLPVALFEKSPARTSAVIFICGVVLRLILIFRFDHYEIGRPEPIRIAISLAEHGTFADPYAIPTGPTAHSPPLYPMIIAPLYKIWGNTRRADFARFVLNTLAASLEYALLPAVSITLGMGAWPGILAGFGGALIPVQNWAECMGDFETTFISLFLEVATIVFARFLRAPRFDMRRALASGLMWGVGFLLAPVVLPVLAGFAAIAAWKLRPKIAVAALPAAAFITGVVVMLAPWTIRNYLQLHGVFFVRDNFGLELFVSNHEDASPHSDTNFGRNYFRATHPHMSIAAARELIYIGEVQFHHARGVEALNWIRAHPHEFVLLSGARTIEFWFPSVPRYRWVLWSASIAGFAGLIALAFSRFLAAVILGSILLTYSAIYSIVMNTLRYEHPLWWIQVLLIGWLVYLGLRRVGMARYLPLKMWESTP